MASREESEIWETFGLEQNLLGDFDHWTVLLRPRQVTPGSLVLIANRFRRSMGELSPDEGAELGSVCRSIEQELRSVLGMVKVNYLALMMVDAHLHFHVIPRYPDPIEVAGRTWTDDAWPGPPDLGAATDDELLLDELRERITLGL